MRELRPIQSEQVDAVVTGFRHHPSQLLISPTGTGKTVIITSIVDKARAGNVLVLAHREELVMQLWQTMTDAGIDVGIEMNTKTTLDQGLLSRPRVVVASVASITSGSRLEHVVTNPDHWSLTVIDEAHHAAAKSYRKILAHMFKNSSHKLLGVTATPDRMDKRSLLEIFDTVAHEYTLKQAMDDGYLVPIKYRVVEVKSIDLDQVRSTAGDLNKLEVSRIMGQEKHLHAVAEPTRELAASKRAVIFCVSVEQATRLAEILNRAEPDSAVAVSGLTPADERQISFQQFSEGKIRYLCNCMIATEGWDCPECEVVVLARPTKSRALYAQMVGRGLRPLPDVLSSAGGSAGERRAAIASSDKPECLVLDFVGNCSKHRLANAFDLIEPDSGPRLNRAKRIAATKDEAVDLEDCLEEADESLEEDARQLEREREERRAVVRARVDFGSTVVDPFAVLDMDAPTLPSEDEALATDRQCDFLSKWKVDARFMRKSDATKLQREIFRRQKHGLCTIAQCRILKAYGVQDTEITKAKASELIDYYINGGKQSV